MKFLAYVSVILAALSIAAAIFSRYTMAPIDLLPGGLDAESLLLFANTCFLAGITLILISSEK